MNEKLEEKCEIMTEPMLLLKEYASAAATMRRRALLKTKRSILKKLSIRIQQEHCFCSQVN